MSITIIGGTGIELSTHPALKNIHDEVVTTRWGKALVTRACLDEQEIFFLHRHADPETGKRHIPPHKINYRANIAALRKLGTTAIFAATAVGGFHADWPSGTLVLLDQFIDATTNREKTFFDDYAVHVDFTQPYCPRAQEYLRRAARELGYELKEGGTYICTEGPRFETPAEIKIYKSWGADVVGMTGVPEVVLAREAEISYAGISIVTNPAAGISDAPLTHAEVTDAMKVALPHVVDLFLKAAREYHDDPAIPSRRPFHEAQFSDYDPRAIFE